MAATTPAFSIFSEICPNHILGGLCILGGFAVLLGSTVTAGKSIVDIAISDLTNTGINLHSGDVFNVSMTYDGTILNVRITDTVTEIIVGQVYAANIPSLVGGNTAYVGFTGSTGGLTANQNILNWTFTPT